MSPLGQSGNALIHCNVPSAAKIADILFAVDRDLQADPQ
jgi:hypothetical protein